MAGEASISQKMENGKNYILNSNSHTNSSRPTRMLNVAFGVAKTLPHKALHCMCPVVKHRVYVTLVRFSSQNSIYINVNVQAKITCG